MKKIIKNLSEKIDINQLFIYFLIFQPIFDLNFFYSSKVTSFFKFSPSTILRIFFIFAFCLYFLYKNRQSKCSKRLVKYLFIILIYSILHIVNSKMFFVANKTGTFEFSLTTEIFYLLRISLPVLIIYIVYNLKFSHEDIKKIFKNSILIYSLVIILSSVFKFGITTYGNGTISYNLFDIFQNNSINHYSFATRGLFVAGNRIGVLLTALLPISIYYMIVDNKKVDYIICLIQIVSLILVGTRVATYCWIFIVIIMLVLYLFFVFIKRNNFNIIKLLYIVSLLCIGLLMVSCSPIKNRKIGNDYNSAANDKYIKLELDKKQEELNNKIEKIENNSSVNNNENTSDVYNTKIKFIKENYENYYIQNVYIEDIYNYKKDPDFWLSIMNIPFSQRNNGRIIQGLITNHIFEENSNNFDILFGMGYSRFRNASLYIEQDGIVHFYTLGIIGIIIFIIIPYICPLLLYVANIIKKRKLDFEMVTFCCSLSSFLPLAFVSGHVIDEMITYIYMSLLSGIILLHSCDKEKKSKEKLISVIIPIYNSEKYLNECLDSLVNQSYSLNNLEVIMIDDYSTDLSRNIAENYVKKYGFKLICNKKNMGPAISRNKGIDMANGKYICFVDSDDLVSSKMIEVLYNNIENSNADCIMSKLNSFNLDGFHGYYSDKYMQRYKDGNINQNFDLINCISICGKLYKREFILKNNIYFLENTYHEDNSFSLTIYIKAKKIIVLPEYLYYRRIRENKTSIMQNLNIEKFKDLLKNYEFIVNNNTLNYKYKLLIIKKSNNYILKNVKKHEQVIARKYLNKFIKKEFSNIYYLYSDIYYNFFLFFSKIYEVKDEKK